MPANLLTAFSLVAVLIGSTAQVPSPDPLLRARQAYNERKYDAAVGAAREAERNPGTANAARVVLGRALLDRGRSTADGVADFDAARRAFASVRPAELGIRDRVDFLVGLGVSLFHDGCVDGCFSGAAEFFDQALDRAAAAGADREAIFEWWANALDQQALHAQDLDRPMLYRRILARAEAERAAREDSASAAYWIAAGARGAGDFERAWGAAIAGWIQGRYLGASGEKLRTDLDDLVRGVLLPERARDLVPDDPRPMLGQLLDQWDALKARYK
jgi:hypothetical protein